MSKGKFKRLGSALLAFVMLISTASGLVIPAKADSWPNDTASAEPTFAGYRVKDIENWDPATDPYAEFLVADVPLLDRNEAFAATQAKPYLTTDAQVMNMTGDYGNSFFGSTMYTNEFSEDVMTFWQYTDYFSPWHGAATAYTPQALYDPVTSDWRARGFEFGIVNIPNPAYTNAAHKNGVMSIACIYFDPAFRPGQTCADMLTEKDGEVYVVAKKLVEMAEYYGFDGYFLNQEEGYYEGFKPFMAYLTAQGLYTQWYDTNSTFNSSKAAWLKDQTYGQIHNSVFVNYSGFSGIDSQLSYAESIGVDPHAEIFYGVECNQANFGGSHYSATSMTNLYDATGNPRASYALFCGSDRYHRGLEGLNTSGDGESVPTAQKDAYQWMSEERERMFWSGVMEDPTNTGFKSGYSRPDVDVNDADGWVGVADFIAERSVIGGNSFYTNFNTGHGMQYFVNGAVSKDEEWTNINIQEQLPTWQWWFESTDSTKLHADFDYGDALVNKTVTGAVKEMPYTEVGAWNGGSSLVVYGGLSGTDTMHLFKTDLNVTESTAASLTFQKVSKDDAVMKLGLIFKDDAENMTAIELDGTAAAGDWTTVTADLSAYAGRRIAALCLIFEGEADAYQMNLGNITISDKDHTPAAPEGFVIDTAFIDGQMILRWEKADYSEVVQYNLYGKQSDGSRIFLGGIYGEILYVKNTFCDDVIDLELVAVGIDGSESEPAVITYNYNEAVRNIQVAEAASGNGLTTHAANAGLIEVTFEAPAAGAPDSYELEVKLHNIEADDPYNQVYTAAADGSATSAEVAIAAREGYEYDLKIYPVRDGVRGEAIAYRGHTHDAYSEPIAAEDVVLTGSTVRLVDPDSHDWYRMTATFNGSQVASFKRGASSGSRMTFSLSSTTGLLEVVVEDFSGNFSEPTVMQLENGVLVDPTDLIGEEHIPDAALRSAVRTQVGVTLTALSKYEGGLDLSGTAVADLTGLELIPGLTAINFTGCSFLEEISGLEANVNLNEINITRCSALKVLDVAGLGLEKLVGDGTFNDLVAVDISDNRLDLSQGTPERAFLDTAISVIENGETTEPDPEPEVGEFVLGENLLPAASVVSSTNTDNASLFVDGDTATSTYATDRNKEASLVLDLGSAKSIGGFAIWTQMNSDDPARPFGVKSAKLETADAADGTYTLIGDATITAGTVQGEMVSAQVKLDEAVTAQFVRITVTEWWGHPNGGNDWPAMYEAEVFEAVAAQTFAVRPMSTEAGVRFAGQRPVPYAAVAAMTEPIVREVANETLDMSVYAELSATIRGTAYETLGGELINGVSFLADDVDLSAKPAEELAISIADQNRQGIEGSVIDLSFDATWTVLYKNASGKTIGTVTVIVGDGGKITTPELMTGNVTILYATTVSGQVASEMPIFAFDGNEGTKWCPGGNAIQAELSIDVGAWYTLTQVDLIHAGARESGRNTVDFDFQVLKDTEPTAEQLADTAYLTNDDNWQTVASYRSNTANETHITFDEPVVGRYFRLDVLKGDNSAQWPSTRIYEWSMTGIPAGEPEAPVYTITVAETTGGTVTADKTEAKEGETVNLTVTPDEGYMLSELKVNDIVIEGTSFEMPGRDVVITAEFWDIDNEAVQAAREAQAAAEAAQLAAEEAQRQAEEAQAAAEEAANNAEIDREAAEKAQAEAEEAQAAAESAAAAAEEALAAAQEAEKAAAEHDAAAAAAAAEAAKRAQEVAELYEQVAAAKAEMAQYLSQIKDLSKEAEEDRKEAEAAELACARYYALILLVQYAEDSEIRGEALDAALNAGIEAINAAETVEAIEEALAEAKAAIDALAEAAELPFADVPADAYYAEAVKWAVANGITTGTSETTFSPEKTVSRAEAVTFLWRSAGEPEPTTAVNPFTDVAESDFFYKAVLWAVEKGITTGLTATEFGPYATANRAQIVTFLWRALDKPEAAVENPFADVAEGAWYEGAVLWALENGITTGMDATHFGPDGLCNRAQMVTFLFRAYSK